MAKQSAELSIAQHVDSVKAFIPNGSTQRPVGRTTPLSCAFCCFEAKAKCGAAMWTMCRLPTPTCLMLCWCNAYLKRMKKCISNNMYESMCIFLLQHGFGQTLTAMLLSGLEQLILPMG